MGKFITKINSLLDQVISLLLIFSVILLAVLSLVAIVSRFFEITNLWIDPAIRHIVLLCMFLGGSLAVGKRQHIKIDIISKFLEYKKNHSLNKIIFIIVSIVSTIILFYLYKASHSLMLTEKEFGHHAFLGLHSSTLIAILPYGFFAVFLRMLTQTIQELISSQSKENYIE